MDDAGEAVPDGDHRLAGAERDGGLGVAVVFLDDFARACGVPARIGALDD